MRPLVDQRTALGSRLWLLALCFPALALEGSGGGASGLPDRGEESEHFLLEWQGERPHPSADLAESPELRLDAGKGMLGVAQLRRSRLDHGWQLELEVSYPFERVRLLGVECLNPRSPRLVWREILPRGGRTVFAEWTEESAELRAHEWGMDGSLRERKSTCRGAVMPHYLLELARCGQVTGGTFEVFDPLLRDLSPWTLSTSYELAEGVADEAGGGGPRPRRVELRREDGTLAGSYLFQGTQLVSFRWQEGEVEARRITETEYDELRARWRMAPAESVERARPRGVVVKDVSR